MTLPLYHHVSRRVLERPEPTGSAAAFQFMPDTFKLQSVTSRSSYSSVIISPCSFFYDELDENIITSKMPPFYVGTLRKRETLAIM